MAAQRKSTDERLETLRQQQDRLKARLAALETRKKSEDRRIQTRRAFVVGAAALAHAEADPSFREALRNALKAAGLRDGDRAVIADLLGLAEAPPAEAPPGEPAVEERSAG